MWIEKANQFLIYKYKILVEVFNKVNFKEIGDDLS